MTRVVRLATAAFPSAISQSKALLSSFRTGMFSQFLIAVHVSPIFSQSPPVGTRDSFSASEIQEHLPLMIKLLRQNDSLNMAVCLQTNVSCGITI